MIGQYTKASCQPPVQTSLFRLDCSSSYSCDISRLCVQLRGIQVGSVLNVQPHLDRVDVLIQVDDEHTVIPRNSRLYANQSGLIAEPLVDIMPQDPIPEYTASPLSDTCKYVFMLLGRLQVSRQEYSTGSDPSNALLLVRGGTLHCSITSIALVVEH